MIKLGSGITDRGAIALAGARHLASLRDLYFGINRISEEARGVLAASPHLHDCTCWF